MYIFQPLTLSIALLQSSDDKGNSKSFVQRIVISYCHDSCEQLQSGVQQRKLPLGLGSILRPKLGTIQSKRHCSLSCQCTNPSFVATSIVAVLQAPDGKDSG